MLGQQEHTVRIGTLRYVIYVPAGDDGPLALAECLAYAEREFPAWTSAGVVVGRWLAVSSMIDRRMVDVVLIARRSHLPPDRMPRIVAVEEEPAARCVRDSRRPTQRRPMM
jgi:hypothetical protein